MNSKLKIALKILATIAIIVLGGYVSLIAIIIGAMAFNILPWILIIPCLPIPVFLLILLWQKDKKIIKKCGFISLCVLIISGIGIGSYLGYEIYQDSITIDNSPNINTFEYLPFDEESKIVKLENASLKLEDNLPIIDGAAAVFPVYSAFVNAVYPETTELYDGVFEYNNTSLGYELLAQKEIDIFFGAYPSKDQITYAESLGVEFEFTPIGSEAFVFFVNSKNNISSLTKEQIQSIYAGEITNWKEVGGDDEEIVAYQRNEGSGSQSMLKRFMEGKTLMKAPTEQVNDLMVGIIDVVSDYKSTTSSIGFSFRYYVEGIIKNPNIKMISIDGIEPTVENIKNGTYPVTTSLYAVTYKGNDNENVQKLINWVLSEEGQYIIEETGYVGIN